MSWRTEVEEAVREEVQGRSDGYHRITCPACMERKGSPDRKRSLSVNLENGWWKCWRCDLRGRLSGSEDGEVWEDDDGWEDVEPEVEAPSDFASLRSSYAAWGAVEYLQRRGVPPTTWEAAGLGYARTGKHGGRIIMPTSPTAGPSAGWVGRAIGRKAWPPYYAAQGLRREAFYLGEAPGRGERLYVVEGPMDALALWPHALACLGKPTIAQRNRIATWKGEVVVVLDGDAWRESRARAQSLRVDGVPAYSVLLPCGRDPGDTSPHDIFRAGDFAQRQRLDVDLK